MTTQEEAGHEEVNAPKLTVRPGRVVHTPSCKVSVLNRLVQVWSTYSFARSVDAAGVTVTVAVGGAVAVTVIVGVGVFVTVGVFVVVGVLVGVLVGAAHTPKPLPILLLPGGGFFALMHCRPEQQL